MRPGSQGRALCMLASWVLPGGVKGIAKSGTLQATRGIRARPAAVISTNLFLVLVLSLPRYKSNILHQELGAALRYRTATTSGPGLRCGRPSKDQA